MDARSLKHWKNLGEKRLRVQPNVVTPLSFGGTDVNFNVLHFYQKRGFARVSSPLEEGLFKHV
jgi:hypothetical protein